MLQCILGSCLASVINISLVLIVFQTRLKIYNQQDISTFGLHIFITVVFLEETRPIHALEIISLAIIIP